MDPYLFMVNISSDEYIRYVFVCVCVRATRVILGECYEIGIFI